MPTPTINPVGVRQPRQGLALRLGSARPAKRSGSQPDHMIWSQQCLSQFRDMADEHAHYPRNHGAPGVSDAKGTRSAREEA